MTILPTDVTDDRHVEAIHEEASKIRYRLEQRVDELKEQTEQLLDWRTYVRSHPIPLMSAAFAVGFLLAPSRQRHAEVVPIDESASRFEKVDEDEEVAPSALQTLGMSILQSTLAFAGQHFLSRMFDHFTQRTPVVEENGREVV